MIRLTPAQLGVRDRRAISLVCVVLLVGSVIAISQTEPTFLPRLAPPLLVLCFGAWAVARPHAAYGGRRGTAVEMNAQGVIHLAGVIVLPPAVLPILLYVAFLDPRRPGLWQVWNLATHTACLAAASWTFWSLQRFVGAAELAQGSPTLSPAVFAAICAVLVYWVVETTTYTWFQWVTQRQSPADTDMWHPRAIVFDLCLLSVGVYLGLAEWVNPWMVLLAIPAVVVAVLGIQSLDEASEAAYDRKTGLLALPAFQQWATRDLALATRRVVPLSLVMVDLDHFRDVNTLHGHQTGDDVLRHVAGLVSDGRRCADLVARYGGEELVLLLPDASVEDAARIAEDVRVRVATSPTSAAGRDITVTASFGVAQARPGETLTDLVARADRALYAAKDAGRNCVHIAPQAQHR